LCDIVVAEEPLKVVPDAAPEPALLKVTACEVCVAVVEVVANEAVPCSEPVIPADTLSDPVILDDPSEKNPFFILNSFGISFPYPRIC
jgi:hypothetical protein